MVRYAVIGTSWITESFIQGTNTFGGLKLTAVYSRSKEKGEAFAKKYNAEYVFDNLEKMAESDKIDAVYIASPNVFHYSQSKLFLENGKHVICEKPITVEPEELIKLQSLAKEKNLIYMEAIMMLHLPQRKVIKEALKKIGKITSARFDFSQFSSKYEALAQGEIPNIFNPKMATGCLMDLGIYCVYPAIDFFGEPKEIINRATFLKTGADSVNNAVFIYPDKQVNISCSKVGQSHSGSEIMGDKGTITISSISKLTDMDLILQNGEKENLVGNIEKHILMSYEAKSFYNYITDFEKYKDEYYENNKITLTVSKIMKKMRDNAGISFDF